MSDVITAAYSARAAEYAAVIGSAAAAHHADRHLIEAWGGAASGLVIDAGWEWRASRPPTPAGYGRGVDGEITLADGVVLRGVRESDAEALAEAYRANGEHLKPWEPARDDAFFTAEYQRAQIEKSREAFAAGTAVAFVITTGGRVVGRLTLTGIVRGAFQSVNLGYWIAADHQGRGLMTAAVRAASTIARDELRLHRIQAATLLHNDASQAVLRKCGFTEIGVAPGYLRIAGRWQDHRLFQLILTP